MLGETKDKLTESNFGKIIYRVEFNDITCDKICFHQVCGLAKKSFADIKNIKLYGLAINAAEIIKSHKWFLTDEGLLVCGDIIKQVNTLRVNINVDENLKILPFMFTRLIREHSNYPVKILGLDVEVGNRSSLWCVFQ